MTQHSDSERGDLVERPIGASDPSVILAGIKQFGLAPDGSDLRDLATALASLREERDVAIGQRDFESERADGMQRDRDFFRERVRVLEGALRYGREAVMESFDHVQDQDDQMLADARLQAIDAALNDQSAAQKQETSK